MLFRRSISEWIFPQKFLSRVFGIFVSNNSHLFQRISSISNICKRLHFVSQRTIFSRRHRRTCTRLFVCKCNGATRVIHVQLSAINYELRNVCSWKTIWHACLYFRCLRKIVARRNCATLVLSLSLSLSLSVDSLTRMFELLLQSLDDLIVGRCFKAEPLTRLKAQQFRETTDKQKGTDGNCLHAYFANFSDGRGRR